jgi:predicted nucleic acid-binding protein
MKKYLIDTNVLILLATYQHKEPTDRELRIKEFYASCTPSELCIPDFIIQEYETVMYRVILGKSMYKAHTKSEIALTSERLLSGLFDFIDIYTTSQKNLYMGYEIYKKHRDETYISLIDATLLSIAKNANASLVTLDKKLNFVAQQENIFVHNP